MKGKRWLLLAALGVFFVPTPARAQVTPPAVNTKAVFAIMQRNVANIKQPAERERWDANIAMWQVALNAPARGDVVLLKASIEKMKHNVAGIMPPGEEQRWLANVTLWQAYIDGNRPPAKGNDLVATTFEKMKKNVARLTESPEKERWQANIDLWQSLLTPQP